MSFFDHVTITLKTGIADHVKSDTCNHANKAVSFECYRWYHLSAMITKSCIELNCLLSIMN